MSDFLTDGSSGLSGNTLGGVVSPLKSLLDDVTSAGAGATITQEMVDNANKVKPAVDKANG
ncbi:hypothetical protein [Streptomyces sp. NPDC051214]|uniref:hypothetical protein n=1 Tax=Streptomyces sp. NPDC051214 TaxID=3155282 RepID=UPI003436E47B